jgi:hypothetical protein
MSCVKLIDWRADAAKEGADPRSGKFLALDDHRRSQRDAIAAALGSMRWI